MRAISLRNAAGELASNAPEILLAFEYFPEDEDCRRQSLMLAADERDRIKASPTAPMEPTALTQTVVSWANKKSGRAMVSGLVALAFITLWRRTGHAPTQYEACNTVARAMKANRNSKGHALFQWQPDGEVWVTEGIRAPSSREDITKAFKEFVSVSHLWAAGMVCSEYFVPTRVLEQTKETILVMLKTAASIEMALAECAAKYFRDQWSVIPDFPNEGLYLPAAPMETDVRTFLESGIKMAD